MQSEDLLQQPEFHKFIEQVVEHLEQQQPNETELRSELEGELQQLMDCTRGWKQSLGDPNLSESLREELQAEWEQARLRMDEINCTLESLNHQTQSIKDLANPSVVAKHLMQFSETLSGENPSAMNVLLSQHIEGIYCDQSGNIKMRTSNLGVIPGAIDMVSRKNRHNQDSKADLIESDTACKRAIPRRRTRRNLVDLVDDDDLALSLNDFAVDITRFDGLDPQWFTVTSFNIPEDPTWREQNAKAIAQWRIDNAATMEETAEHFERTVPTIRAALREAMDKHGIDAMGRDVSLARRKCWAKEHAKEVAEYLSEPGRTIKQATEHFGKSEPTISKAKKLGSK